MSVKYKLKFTQIAADDLDQIYEYIASELFATQAAENLIGKIEKQIARLCEFPYSSVPISDSVLRAKGYYKLPIDQYLVFYVVNEKEKTVVIMRIIYGARQYEQLL